MHPDSIAKMGGREYDIVSVQLDGEFDIGLRQSGEKEPLRDIVPSEIYESVSSAVGAAIDEHSLQEETSGSGWQQIGSCALEVRTDEVVGIEITIRESWLSEENHNG